MWTTEWSLSSVYSFMFFQAPFCFWTYHHSVSNWMVSQHCVFFHVLPSFFHFRNYRHKVDNWMVFPPLCIISCSSTLSYHYNVGHWKVSHHCVFFHAMSTAFMFFQAPNIFGLITATLATEWFIIAVYYFMFIHPFLYYQGILLSTTHSFILLLKLCWLLIFLNSSGNIFHSFADV